ncbi:MAG: acyl carrier protein [Bacteroidales bacterium]|jgi:acyl carrier protein|nr:acyl carrier protein [Bacteroidales bacterium]
MDTSNNSVKEKVKEYIQQATFVEKDKIKDDSLIFKEGYFDSMGFVVLITFLEENFGIKTVDADLIEENFESINAITDFVIRKRAN